MDIDYRIYLTGIFSGFLSVLVTFFINKQIEGTGAGILIYNIMTALFIGVLVSFLIGLLQQKDKNNSGVITKKR